MTQLNLFLLGAPRIEVNDQPIHTDRRKAVALLAYLVVEAKPYSREALATLLWPNSDQSRALAYLRRTLWEINKMVGEGWLEISREQVVCSQHKPIWSDVAAFSQKTAVLHHTTSLIEAISLYQDDFMAGFSLRDAPLFDEWHYYQTEHWRQELATALQVVSQTLAQQGEWQSALTYAQRRLAQDPLHEPAHRQLMQLYSDMGQRTSALRQYQNCRHRLAQELEVLPEPETTALYEHIRQGTVTNKTAPAQAPPNPLAPIPPRRPNTLPLPTTSFVGRQSELNEITTLLESPQVRLLTLVGLGGSGKTRLALQVAYQLREHFSDGLVFVPLAPLQSSDDLVTTIIKHMHLGILQEDESPHNQLLAYLQAKHMLLVMDNYEHLLASGGANLVEELLQAAPQLKVLATSRMRLGLRAEHQYIVPGMGLPDINTAQAWLNTNQAIAEQIAPYSALQLFAERARHVLAAFTLDKQTLLPVINICQLVDGSPLAIELAASWLELLTVTEIETEIRRNIDFLATEAPDAPERQRSMRAVFNYSWQLLTEAEQATFPKLTIFQGGFSLQAGQHVTRASLPTIKSLVNKSLLKRGRDGRFSIHELLLQYAAEKLQADPTNWMTTRDLHAVYYLDFLRREGRRMGSTHQRAAFDAVEQEFENVRSAWLWAMMQQQYQLVLPTVTDMLYYFLVRATLQPGLADLIDIVLQDLEAAVIVMPVTPGQPTTEQKLYTNLLAIQAWVAKSNVEASSLTQKAITTIQQWQMTNQLGLPLVLVATSYVQIVDETEGLDWGQQGLAVLRQGPPSWELAMALNTMGALYHSLGFSENVEALLHEGIAISRQIGDDLTLAYNLTTLGWVWTAARQFDQALQINQECQPLFEKVGDWAGAAYNLRHLAAIYDVAGQYELAARHYRKSGLLFTELGRHGDVAVTLGSESQMWQRLGHYETALSLRQQAFNRFKEVEDLQGIAWSHFELGEIYRLLCHKAQAEQHYQQSFAHFSRLQLQHGLIFYYRVLGRSKLSTGDVAGARAALEQSISLVPR